MRDSLAALRSEYRHLRRLAENLGPGRAIYARGRMLASDLGWRCPAAFRMHPGSVNYPVEVRMGSTDAEAFRQVLRDQEYAAFDDLDLRTIVDCGANVGYASAFFLSRFPRARVIAIEPFASNAGQCRRNLAPYGDRASVIESAIWNRKTRLAIEDPGGGEWAIRVRPVTDGAAGDVDAIDIPSLGLPRIDLLKIDIERSEIDLFASDADHWLASVSNIAIELHGPDCAAAFAKALRGFDCDWSRSGELTICRNIRSKAAAAA